MQIGYVLVHTVQVEQKDEMLSVAKKLNMIRLICHGNVFTLKEERLREEAPTAYKPITPVIDAQQNAGLIQTVVKPLTRGLRLGYSYKVKTTPT